MMKLLRAILVSLLLPLSVFAQSADQEVVSVVDSPDPVTPGATLAYTVTIRNNGPDPAVNGGLNINLPLAVTHTTDIVPAGWTCFWLGSNGSCITPSFAVGTQVVTINVQVGAHLANFPDQSIAANFFPSGTTIDPNSGNNSKGANTLVDSPQVDVSVVVTDSPDPVFPNGNITYTIDVANAGPDAATDVNFNVYHANGLKFVSGTQPAGWNCTFPAVGGTPIFTCSRATFPMGTSQFQVVLNADPTVVGINDGTFFVAFSAAGTGDDTNDPNNTETESTAYTTQDADTTVSVTDSPDPVFPDGNITYTVTVGNTGPDAAPNAQLNLFNSGTLQYQSAIVPPGWNCSLPSVNATPTFSCTNPSFANGASSVFTFVVKASAIVLGLNDGTVSTAFSVGSAVTDPDNTDNAETENTAYVTPDADMNITATDSPDPVVPDGDITYTVTVTNQGPDPAPNAKMTVAGNGGQTRFVSGTTPAGWSCAYPAAGTLLNVAGYQCTHPSFPNGASAVFTVVTDASDDLHPNSDHNITQAFTTQSDVADPDNLDNSITVTTAYDVPNANLVVTNTDTPDPATQGGTITYTQSITNNGPDTAANATFTQSVPTGTTFQSFNAPGWLCTTPAVGATGAINCSLASMANGASTTFTLVVNVTGTGTGTITSTVTGSSDANDPVPANNTAIATTTVPSPINADMSITKSTTATSAPIGSTFSYTIVVTNNGPDAATSVVMTDTLPSSLLFRSITQPSPFTCTTPAVGATGTITCTAATLANGASRTFTLVVEVAAGASGSIVNSGSVTSAATDGNSGNSGSNSSGVTAAPASADISIVKSTTSNQAVTGTTITYTILVSNAGPSPATNVIVTDDLPAGMAFLDVTPSQGSCNAADPVSCNLGTILSGANATITLRATVTATSGTVANTASVTSTEGGGDSSTTPSIPVVITAEFTAVPTLSEWALIALALAIAALALKARL
jgi:uncharacterized repeat protein (TIGR01451 family)